MDKIRVSAKTKDDAITQALIKLGITSDRLSYNVIVQGSNGLFGIGAKPWILEASVKEEPEDLAKPEEETAPAASVAEKPSQKEAAGQQPKAPLLSKEEAGSTGKAGQQEGSEGSGGQGGKAQGAEAGAEAAIRPEEAQGNDTERPASREEGFASGYGGYGRESRRDRYRERDRRDYKSRRPKGGGRDKRYRRGGYEIFDAMPREIEPAPVPVEKEIQPISEEAAQDAMERGEKFLSSVLSGMKMEVTIKSSFDHSCNELMMLMEGPDMGILIGKRGQTLDSLQYITSLYVNKEHKDGYIRVKLDTEDYRKRREQTLRSLARNISYKVKRSRRPFALEPMNPYERRIIHSALQNDRYVTTRSEGEEPFRHVIVYLRRG